MTFTEQFWESQRRHFASAGHPGARGRKARWAARHALHRRNRRRPHPAREVRRVQRFIRHDDMLQRFGVECVDCAGQRAHCAACWVPIDWCECHPEKPVREPCSTCCGWGRVLMGAVGPERRLRD
jgi:hypothetical protein